MKRAFLPITAISGFVLLSSCISSEESGANRQDPIVQESVSLQSQASQGSDLKPPKETYASAQQATQSRGSRLTSRQDTLVASITRGVAARARSAQGIKRPKDPSYTVQVGAFSRAQNALRYQKLSRERFPRNSVHNLYEAQRRLYKVSIGKFTTRKEAASLRREIIKKYPKEYSQAWVNYITK